MTSEIQRIMLIEDNPGDAVLFQEQLSDTADPFEVVVCSSLAEGIRSLAAGPIAVVFLDLSLRESIGLTTVQEARAAFEDLPIVVLTGLEDERLGIESLRAGAQDYLIKGQTTGESISRVARYAIERQRILLELQAARDHLEEKVLQRTAELAETVHSLKEEVRQRKLAEKRLSVRATQLRALAGELTLAEQRERRRLAQMLHDHLQQLLVAANLRVSMLAMTGSDAVKRGAQEVRDLLEESIAATRTLTAELSPQVLHDLGLSAGLEWLAQWMADKHELAVHVAVEKDLAPLAEDVNVLLFESVRELLFNAAKHAHVSAVEVRMQRTNGDELQIVVSDSGRGFDPTRLKQAGETGGGFGLFSIRERLDLIGGRMEIESAVGHGSCVRLTAPLLQSASKGSRGGQACS